MGRCKSLGLLKPSLSYASQLSGVSVLGAAPSGVSGHQGGAPSGVSAHGGAPSWVSAHGGAPSGSVLMGEHLVGSVVIRREHLVGSVLIRGVPSEVSAAACAFHIRLPHPELLNTHHGKWEWLMAAIKQACSSWTQKFTFGGLESLMAVTSLFINMAGNTPLHTIHTHVIISQVL